MAHGFDYKGKAYNKVSLFAFKIYLSLIKLLVMAYDLKELMALPVNDKKEIIADLMESINEEEIGELPEWKKKLYTERLAYYKQSPNEGVEWNELRKKYFSV